MSEHFDKFRKLLADYFGVDIDTISRTTKWTDDRLKMSHTGIIKLTMDVEDAFDVEIHEELFVTPDTVGETFAMIVAAQATQAA